MTLSNELVEAMSDEELGDAIYSEAEKIAKRRAPVFLKGLKIEVKKLQRSVQSNIPKKLDAELDKLEKLYEGYFDRDEIETFFADYLNQEIQEKGKIDGKVKFGNVVLRVGF